MNHGEAFWNDVDILLDLALREDIGPGDATSNTVIPEGTLCKASFTAREPGIMAGFQIIRRLYEKIDKNITIIDIIKDGDHFNTGDVLATVEGPARAILTGERTVLNIMQRMCGVATMAHDYVKLVKGTGVRILDTRKTIPGWRALDKLAVFMGGASNHRRGLYDMVMIKDNHIAQAAKSNAVASAAWAVETAKENTDLKVEVEVDTLEQLREVLHQEPYQILLDNMDTDTLREAVKITGEFCSTRNLHRPILEASGGITRKTIAEVARTGIDCISVGALTHSVRALDIGLDMDE